MALHGTLQQASLRELIDLAVYSSLTGSLDITGERSGRVFFLNGQIYHIECDGQIGSEALGLLLNVQDGTFNVTSGAHSEHQSVWGDHESIIRNAERTALRWRRLWHHVPSLNLIPVLVVSEDEAKRQTSVALHVLIEAIDGRKRLNDLATELRWSAIDVVEGVVQLITQRLVQLEHAQPVHREPTPAPSPRPTPSVMSSVDRLLAILRS
ncbi:MAG: DUF4388 domain-containing protein [Chloroflexi bacterium]|jgi:hypothetical protein|nr:MAG: DUF4388 domain-containing protein [Chloroflexota bacterium]